MPTMHTIFCTQLIYLGNFRYILSTYYSFVIMKDKPFTEIMVNVLSCQNKIFAILKQVFHVASFALLYNFQAEGKILHNLFECLALDTSNHCFDVFL